MMEIRCGCESAWRRTGLLDEPWEMPTSSSGHLSANMMDNCDGDR